jgi:hypothetical protein
VSQVASVSFSVAVSLLSFLAGPSSSVIATS